MSKQPSWRSVLRIHPAAELFPLMPPDELRVLGEDIRKHGLHEPVVLQKQYRRGADGSIRNEHDYELALIDGRGRLDAMEEADFTLVCDGKLDPMLGHRALGLTPLADGATSELASSVDPYDFVISRNLHRRHLTAKQKREVIAKLLKATPEKSNRQIAETVKASHHTVGAVRAEMEATGQVAQLAKTVGKDRKARKQTAKRPTTAKKPQAPRARRAAQQETKATHAVDKPQPSKKKDTEGKKPKPSPRDLEAKQAHINELEAAREHDNDLAEQLQSAKIKIAGPESEVEEAKAAAKPAPQSKSASRCSICREKKPAVLRPVFVCDSCVDIYEIREAASPADDGLDIPASLRRDIGF